MAKLSETYGVGTTPTSSVKQNTVIPKAVGLSASYSSKNNYEPKPTESVAPTSPLVMMSKNGDRITQNNINTWLSDGYKMNADEQKKAKELYKQFSAYSKVGNNPYAQRNYLNSLSDSDRELALNVDKLYNKVSNLGSFVGGALSAIPGYTKATDKALNYLGADEKNSFSSNVNAQRSQNPLASMAGQATSKIAQYAAFNSLPFVKPVANGLGNALGGGKVAQALGRIGADTIADIALDTVPEVVDNIQSGKSGKEVAIDALKNIGGNVAFNAIPEAVGGLKALNEIRKNKKVVDSALEGVEKIAKSADDVKVAEKVAVNVAESAEPIAESIVKPTLTNKEIDEILVDATKKAEFENTYGIKLDGTKAEQRKQIKSFLNDATDIAEKKPTVAVKGDETTSTIKSTLEDESALNRSKSPNEMAEDIGLKGDELIIDIENEKLPFREALSKTREKLVDRGLATAEEAEKYMPEYDYMHKVMDISETMGNAAKRVDEVGWEKVLDEAVVSENTDFLDPDKYAELIESYLRLKADGNLEGAAKVLERLTRASTPAAQDLRLAREFAQAMPEGKLATSISKAKHAVDTHKKALGYSDAVDDMADALTDAIKSGDDTKVKKVLESNLSDYARNKSTKVRLKDKQIDGQMSIFDYIQEEKAKGRSMSDIAEEAGRLLKKNADAVTISTKQEAEMINLFEQMSYLEPDSYAYRQLQGQAMQILDKEMPSTLSAKIKTTLYDNMLGNIKTAVTRNAGGNAMANALELSQKPLRTILDKAVSKATGTRNYVLDGEIAKARKEGFKKGLTEQIADIKSGIQTTRSGQNTLEDALDNVATVYKGSNKLSKGLNAYDKIVKQSMMIGDRPFYEAEYAAAKKELETIVDRFGKDAIQTTGVGDKVNLAKTEDIIEFWARERALEAVFQNKSLSTEAFSKFKEGLSKLSKDSFGADLLSQTAMPFMQVPGNIFSRGLQYSPLGVIKNAVDTATEVLSKDKSFNQKRFVDATSRNLTGLGMLGGAVALANNGNITGSYSDDADRAKAQRDAGELEYALKIGNKQYDVSDLPVVGQMFQAGATAKESMDENKSPLENLAEATKGSVNAMLDTSVLQGLNRFFGTSTYDRSGNIAQNALNTIAAGIPSQLIPSVIRQGTQTLDESRRDLGEYGTPEYYLNTAINSTPLRMALLNEKTNREGDVLKQNDGRNMGLRALENFVLPYKISEPQYSEVTQEANRIYDADSGNVKGYIPSISKNDIKNIKGFDKDNYSYELYSEANKKFGKASADDAKKVIASSYYQSLSDTDKANLLDKIYSANKEIIKAELARKGKSTDQIKSLENSKGIFSYSDKFTSLLAEKGIDEAMEYYKISKAPDLDGNGTVSKAEKLDYIGRNYNDRQAQKWIDFLYPPKEKK